MKSQVPTIQRTPPRWARTLKALYRKKLFLKQLKLWKKRKRIPFTNDRKCVNIEINKESEIEQVPAEQKRAVTRSIRTSPKPSEPSRLCT